MNRNSLMSLVGKTITAVTDRADEFAGWEVHDAEGPIMVVDDDGTLYDGEGNYHQEVYDAMVPD